MRLVRRWSPEHLRLLAAAASCTINVTFTPTTAGTRTGTLTVTHSAAGSSHSVSLYGTGPAPSATVSPTSLTYGSRRVGTISRAKTMTLANTGAASLKIASIVVSADRTQTNTCTTVAAGASCTISVVFKPVATGLRTGSLTISDNVTGACSGDSVRYRQLARSGERLGEMRQGSL